MADGLGDLKNQKYIFVNRKHTKYYKGIKMQNVNIWTLIVQLSK